jgi:CRP-like cAMP-binding protein
VSFFTDRPWQVEVRAGTAPVHALVFSGAHFERLLQQSSEFSAALLRRLALKVERLYERIDPGTLTARDDPAERQDAWSANLSRECSEFLAVRFGGGHRP